MEKKDQYYYNSEEYADRIREVEEMAAEIRREKEEEAKEKEKKCKTEVSRLKRLFPKDQYDKESLHFILSLIDRAAFLRIELEYIERDLQKEGMMDFFIQGTQTMWREHPLSKVHAQHSKSYRETIKQLESYMVDRGGSSKKGENPVTDLIVRGNSAREKYKR
jgi:hypothetical protein